MTTIKQQIDELFDKNSTGQQTNQIVRSTDHPAFNVTAGSDSHTKSIETDSITRQWQNNLAKYQEEITAFTVRFDGFDELSAVEVSLEIDHSNHPKYLEIVRDAQEEGYEPNRTAISNACALFDALPADLQEGIEAFATYDGVAYVKARNAQREHVSFICQTNGSILHRFKMDNYVKYTNLAALDKSVVRFAFQALRPWGQTG